MKAERKAKLNKTHEDWEKMRTWSTRGTTVNCVLKDIEKSLGRGVKAGQNFERLKTHTGR